MTRGGHNRKTAAQAKMDGTFKPSRHTDPLVLAPGTVSIPTGVEGRAVELWNEYVVPRLSTGIYEPAEAPLLAHWCNTLARLMAVNAVTPFEGLYEVEDDLGRTHFVKHPGMSVWKALAEEFRSVSARLALDPISRMQLGDLQAERDGMGAALPNDAPPAWQPVVVSSKPPRQLKPRCAEHGRRWRKTCAECQRVKADET